MRIKGGTHFKLVTNIPGKKWFDHGMETIKFMKTPLLIRVRVVGMLYDTERRCRFADNTEFNQLYKYYWYNCTVVPGRLFVVLYLSS